MTNIEIISLRSSVLLNASSRCCNNTLAFFKLLSETGMRSEEVFRLDDCVHIGHNIYTIETVKYGTGRTVDFTFFKDEMQMIKAVGVKQFFPFSKCTYQRDFNLCLDRKPLRRGNKGIELHFFRHCKIKELVTAGMPRSQIKNYMGLTSTKTVDIYADSIIL